MHPLKSEYFVTLRIIKIDPEEVESGEIRDTADRLLPLSADATIARQYAHSLQVQIESASKPEEPPYEMSDVQKFLRELDAEFPYWFFFLNKDSDSLRTILLSICPHYHDSEHRCRVRKDIFENFMKAHHEALDQMFDLVDCSELERQQARDEINSYYLKEIDLLYWPNSPSLKELLTPRP